MQTGILAYFFIPDAILFNFGPFLGIQLVCDGRMDWWTDGRLDIPSYRDAWTHLKKEEVLDEVYGVSFGDSSVGGD